VPERVLRGSPAFAIRSPPSQAAAFAASVVAAACSSHPPVHPPALDDCLSAQDASCGTSVVVGGGGGGPGTRDASATAQDALPPADAGLPADGGTCTALAVTTSAVCQSCIQQSCCDTCTVDAICVQLIACVQTTCHAGDSTCLATCETQWPMAIAAYDTFAGCLAFNCATQCPAPP
jgi:hypothetical protein